MISRLATRRISDLLGYFPALVLTGARQSGKTTLLKTAFPNYGYVSLDLPSVAAQAEESPARFFADNPPPRVIDEVQYAPGLFRHLKAEIDRERHAMGSWILTGSQKFTLMKSVSESLAGRAAIVELEGLSAAEIAGSGAIPSIEGLIRRGGFPELWRLPDFPAEAFFGAYLSTYLERDLRQLLNVGNLRDFERFIRVLASRNSGELDLSAVGNAVGVTSKTAAAWLSVLEASNQVSLLEPWHANLGKRIVKRPKVYFRDTGFLCWLLGINAPITAANPWAGALWETFAYAEMRKAIGASGANRTIYYYRDNRATEVDFVVAGEGLRLVEAKWTELPRQADALGLRRLAAAGAASGAPEFTGAKGYLLCRTEVDYPIIVDGGTPATVSPSATGHAPSTARVPAAAGAFEVEAVGIGSLGRMLGLKQEG